MPNPPPIKPDLGREVMRILKAWAREARKRMPSAAAKDAAKEAAKEVTKEAVKEALKEGAKEAIKEALKGTSEGADEKTTGDSARKIDGMAVSIHLNGESQKSIAVNDERVAGEISSLREVVASTLAQVVSNQLTDGTPGDSTWTWSPINDCNWRSLAVVGTISIVVIGGVMFYRRLRRRGGGGADDTTVSHGAAATIAGNAKIAAADPSATAHHLSFDSDNQLQKNRLQSFAQRTFKELPMYTVESEGFCHQCTFRCTVQVGGQLFSSSGSFTRKKDTEQDAARIAYECLVRDGDADFEEALELIHKDVVFCKSILHEFAVKTKTTWPSYSVSPLEESVHQFVASVVFDGVSYTGESASNKKHAKQHAARAVIMSILAKHNTCMMGTVRSKKQLIVTATGSSDREKAEEMVQLLTWPGVESR